MAGSHTIKKNKAGKGKKDLDILRASQRRPCSGQMAADTQPYGPELGPLLKQWWVGTMEREQVHPRGGASAPVQQIISMWEAESQRCQIFPFSKGHPEPCDLP